MFGYEHEPAAQRFGARETLEAFVGGVPVLVFVGYLALFDADRFAACRAVFDVYFFEAFAAVGARGFHEVALAAEKLVAVEACKVRHVPATTFRFCAFVGENHL